MFFDDVQVLMYVKPLNLSLLIKMAFNFLLCAFKKSE